jgi:DNA-binding MarR family transcriptional regulator
MKKPSRRVTDLSEELRNALKLLVREMRRDAPGAGEGLPLMQTFLLGTLDEHAGIGVAELARLHNVRGPTISGQVKALEEAGLVERSAPLAEDRRRSGLQVTAAGRALLGRVREQRLDWLSQRVSRLSPGQLAALEAAIEPLNIIAQP